MQATSVADPRPFRAVLALAVLAVLALLAVAGARSYRDLAAARRHEQDLHRRIEEARGEIELLRRRIELLEDDPATLERLAREDLWMARPADVVIVLPEEGEGPALRAPSAAVGVDR